MRGSIEAKAFGTIIMFALLGVFLAIIEAVLYEEGILMDTLVTSSMGIDEFMFVTFFFCFLIGLVLSFLTRD